LPLLFMKISIPSLEAKKKFEYSHNLAIRLLYCTRCPHIQHQFPTKRLKLAMIKLLRLTDVYNWHHNFWNIFERQKFSTNWLMKFHVTFGILSVHQSYFLSSHPGILLLSLPLVLCRAALIP
jgi:hypothetical protein